MSIFIFYLSKLFNVFLIIFPQYYKYKKGHSSSTSIALLFYVIIHIYLDNLKVIKFFIYSNKSFGFLSP